MLNEFIGDIRRAREQIGTAQRALPGALAQLARTARAYATVMLGSGTQDADEIATCLERAGQQATAGLAAAARSERLVASYLTTVLGAAPPDPPPQRSPESTQPAHVRHAVKVREAQARIGRGVRGSETRGAWLHADGSTDDLRSGIDTPWYRRAKAIFSGFGNPRYTRLARHCEGQAVVRMQKEKLREATIILDRAPCGTPPDPADEWTCDQKLGDIMGRMLPAGSTLIVIDPDGTLWRYPKEERS